MASLLIGIDLGGTNIKAGVVTAAGDVVARREVETEAAGGFEHVMGRLVGLVDELIRAAGVARQDVAAIGIGVPGPLSHREGVVFKAPNMPGWENAPVRDRLSAATGLPVSLENDGNAAAFGEFVAGAGHGVRDDAGCDVRDMVMLTLGTGVGCGIVLNGKLWRGSFEAAGEMGHVIAVPNGLPCPCGQRGCLERYASASAVARRAAEAIDAGESSVLATRLNRKATAGKTPHGAEDEGITAATVEQAAREGDRLSARIWDETCLYLAIACINIKQIFDPQQVVLAGGLINAGDALLGPVRRHYEQQFWHVTLNHMRIDLARLGVNAGLIGAAALAQVEFGAGAGHA